MFENINFYGGIITYNDFNILEEIPFSCQKFKFKEDLLQVTYNNGRYVIDIGWYPEFDPNGFFIVFVIENMEWDFPIFEKKTKYLSDLEEIIKEAIEKVKLSQKQK